MDAMQELVISAREYGFFVQPMYVVSEDWAYEACVERFGFYFTMAPNDFIGRKMNAALQELRRPQYAWDWLITSGSDDLLRPAMFASANYMIAEGFKFFGTNECYLLDSETGSLKRHNSGAQIIGAGRWHHRSLIEACDWTLWPDKAMSGLDGRSEERIEAITGQYIQHMPSAFPFVVDVKGEGNIHSFNSIPGAEVDVKRVERLFPALKNIEV